MLEARALTAAEGSGESMVLPLPLKLLGTDLQQDMADLSVDILGDSALPRVGYGFGEGESGNQPNIRRKVRRPCEACCRVGLRPFMAEHRKSSGDNVEICVRL